MKSDNFFAELKRRNVYKVAVAYAIVGWLLVQIATQVFPFLEIPNWVVRLVIALVAIGFPIALVITATTNERQKLAAKAGIRVLAGDITGAQTDATKACGLLETRLRDHPKDFRSLRALSWVYLALNRKSDAIDTARKSVELLPLEKDAVLGSGNVAALAEIQAQTGAATEAVQNLRKLLSIPAGETISIARLKLDPVWDPIRNNAAFQELLAGKEWVGPDN